MQAYEQSSRPGSPVLPVVFISPAISSTNNVNFPLEGTTGDMIATASNSTIVLTSGTLSTANAHDPEQRELDKILLDAMYGTDIEYDEFGEAVYVRGEHLLPGFDNKSIVEQYKKSVTLERGNNNNNDNNNNSDNLVRQHDDGLSADEEYITVGDEYKLPIQGMTEPWKGKDTADTAATDTATTAATDYDDVILCKPTTREKKRYCGTNSDIAAAGTTSPPRSASARGQISNNTTTTTTTTTAPTRSSLLVPGGAMSMQTRRVLPGKASGPVVTKDCDLAPIDAATKFIGAPSVVHRFSLATRFRKHDVLVAAAGADVTVGGPIVRADGLTEPGCKFQKGERKGVGSALERPNDQPGPGAYKVLLAHVLVYAC